MASDRVIHVSAHALENIRERCGHGQHSDAFLRDQMVRCVMEELKQLKPQSEYPQMYGGEHRFVARMEPSTVNGLDRPAVLVVNPDTHHGAEWVIVTVLTEEIYNTRIEARKRNGDRSQFDATQDRMASIMREGLLKNEFVVTVRDAGGHLVEVVSSDHPEEVQEFVQSLFGHHPLKFVRIYKRQEMKVKVEF